MCDYNYYSKHVTRNGELLNEYIEKLVGLQRTILALQGTLLALLFSFPPSPTPPIVHRQAFLLSTALLLLGTLMSLAALYAQVNTLRRSQVLHADAVEKAMSEGVKVEQIVVRSQKGIVAFSKLSSAMLILALATLFLYTYIALL